VVALEHEDDAVQTLLEMSERLGFHFIAKMNRYSTGESFALHHLIHRDGLSYPSELLEEAGTSSARIAAILKSLEKKGHIVRGVDPEDRRKTVVTITEEGLQRTNNEFVEMSRKFREVFRRLGKEDTGEFLRIFRRFLDIVESMEDTVSGAPTEDPTGENTP